MTIDELYEAFMDQGKWGEEGEFGPKSFAEDIYEFMGFRMEGKGWTPGTWAEEYGVYLPTFDPTGTKLAERKRDVDYKKALDTLNITQEATDRVYTTELDTLSTEIGRTMDKGRSVAGGTGIRSGDLESSIEDTLALSFDKAKDLGDRLQISETETKDKYNAAMVDSALDLDKAKRAEKEAFYNRTMDAITKLIDKGAFGYRTGPGSIFIGTETIEDVQNVCVIECNSNHDMGSAGFLMCMEYCVAEGTP